MTENQLKYLSHREAVRHNLAVESEAARSNMARETETTRANRASEELTKARDTANATIGAVNAGANVVKAVTSPFKF